MVYEISSILLQEVDDRRRVVPVRWHTGAIPHAHRDANGLIYERTGQSTPDGLLIYRTAEWSPPPKQLCAQFEYGPAASRQPDQLVSDPPPLHVLTGDDVYTFFGWADGGHQVPIYRCLSQPVQQVPVLTVPPPSLPLILPLAQTVSAQPPPAPPPSVLPLHRRVARLLRPARPTRPVPTRRTGVTKKTRHRA